MVEISTLTAGRLSTPARERTLQSVVAAFAVDPLLRWVWPYEDRYAGCAGRFFGLLLDLRLMGGEVWVAGGGAAVAMWDPPGGLYTLPAEDPWPALHETFTAVERERWAVFDAAVAVPADAGPYWYLGVLATDPAYQRRGLASAVLAPVLAAADRTGTPAYLETASATNVAYYARHGFIPAREVDLADGPRCWLMRRDAQVRCG
ncbi:MAG: GNAT family N-acetyltransferase [Sporichthyaceae bacterium]|nr:GNAT family N-acetyltransferase [Sporichthyaceae bacterium]